MISLLNFFSLRYALKHPFRVLLSATAVALGVALFVSSDTSNYTVETAFRETNEKLQGNAQLHVTRGRMLGVEDEALKKIDTVSGVAAAPMLQITTTLPELKGEGSLMILGLDFKREASFRLWDVAEGDAPKIDLMSFAMANGILITENLAKRQHFKLGSTFKIDTPGGMTPVSVAAILKDEGPAQVFGGNVAVMPLGTAQRLFDKKGRADRIELIVTGDVEASAQKIRAALGPEYLVEPPPKSNSFLDDAISRVRALMGISVIALLVAIFIIYNSVSISVVQRIKEVGTLRAFGATRGQIFGAILIEWCVVGIIGSMAGVAVGYLLARLFINMTMHEINQVVAIVVVSKVLLPVRAVIGGLVLGIITSLAAAFFPARGAMKIMPIELLRQGLYRIKMKAGYLHEFWLGLAMIAVCAVIWAIQPTFTNAGLGSAVLSFTGIAFALPQVTFWMARAARPILGKVFSTPAYLAADNISKFPQRTALTVIALAGALGMMISASAIVLSFKVRGEHWMRVTFPFDCSINATDLTASFYSNATFPEAMAEEINKLDQVAYTYGVRAPFQEFRGKTVMLVSPEIEVYQRMQRDRGIPDFIPPDRFPDLVSGRGVALSDNLAKIHRIKTGEMIELTTLHGPRQFKVLGTVEDYSWPQGTIFIDRHTYRELWDDTGLTYLNIKLKPGVTIEQAKDALKSKLKGTYNLFVYDVNDLLGIANKTLDQSLKFTNIQVAVAILIGFLGIVNTLLISVMHRARELGLLRAIGMTRAQMVRMVVIESVFLATIAGFIGVFLGLIGAKWPLALHVFQIGGFLMPLAIPWKYVTAALISSVAIGFLASYIPARRASTVNVLEAIGYE
ncbi:FtsX-like permease family protein [Candidatus Sumerlaeota bacterium]|nr:FtsX-like permease family protein [Candidatus Sumerlaeota bacterium]